MPNSERSPNLAQWQRDYDRAVKEPGEVVAVYARRGRFGGLAIWVDVWQPTQGGQDGGRVVHYSPYLDSSPGGSHEEDNPDCSCDSCAFDADPDGWLEMMQGATDWGAVDWGRPEEFIPAY